MHDVHWVSQNIACSHSLSILANWPRVIAIVISSINRSARSLQYDWFGSDCLPLSRGVRFAWEHRCVLISSVLTCTLQKMQEIVLYELFLMHWSIWFAGSLLINM